MHWRADSTDRTAASSVPPHSHGPGMADDRLTTARRFDTCESTPLTGSPTDSPWSQLAALLSEHGRAVSGGGDSCPCCSLISQRSDSSCVVLVRSLLKACAKPYAVADQTLLPTAKVARNARDGLVRRDQRDQAAAGIALVCKVAKIGRTGVVHVVQRFLEASSANARPLLPESSVIPLALAGNGARATLRLRCSVREAESSRGSSRWLLPAPPQKAGSPTPRVRSFTVTWRPFRQ